MAAPKGNRFWEARTSSGRDKTFSSPESLWESCLEYFEWNHRNPLEKAIVYQGEVQDGVETVIRAMTIDALCTFLDCDVRTWRNYRCEENYKDFFPVVGKVEQIIRSQKFEGAAAGLLNSNIIARDLGLKDHSETDHKSSDGSMTPRLSMSPQEAAKAYQDLMNGNNS